MAMKLYSDTSVQAIANSLRNINNSETTYKIGQMAPAINSRFEQVEDYIPLKTLDGTSNQAETIDDGTDLPFTKLVINGSSSQTGTPTINNKIDVTNINSATLTIEDNNENSKVKVINFGEYELYQLQDGTKDTLRIENNHLYIDKKVKKIQLTSSMGWLISTVNKGAYCASFSTNYGIEKLNYNMYSSHFTASDTVWDEDYKFGWGASSPNTTLWVTFNSTTPEFNTTNAFKNWLDENDCYIIAKATTAETIDLGEITALNLYEGTNNITLTTNNNTSYTLEYKQDIADNITTALTTLETDLSGDSVYKMIAVGKGTNVTLNDTEEESLDDFKILGKTVQDGTPSPSNPVAIENVWGKNLAYPGWAQDYVTRINDTSKAKLETFDSRRCVHYWASAGYQSYDTKYMFRTNWKPNTQYTISFDMYGSTTSSNFVIRYTDDTRTYPSLGTASTWKHMTVISEANKTIKWIAATYDQGYCYIDLDTFQIEEGTTATTYEKGNCVKIKRANAEGTGHEEQTYLFPLGDQPLMEGDKIIPEGTYHKKNQKILNGSEGITWNVNSYDTYYNFYAYATTDQKNSQIGLVCNISSSTSMEDTINNCYIGGSGRLNFNVSISGVTNSSTWNTWLSSNPVTIEYELATPTITPFTQEQQTVYDTILGDGTYEVVTNYTTEGNLAPEIEVSYNKDLQPRLADIVDEVTDILQ